MISTARRAGAGAATLARSPCSSPPPGPGGSGVLAAAAVGAAGVAPVAVS